MQRALRFLLGICPVLVALLWVGGIARFRSFELAPIDWIVLSALAFALHVIGRRLRRRRPMPALPADANPAILAALAAAIIGSLVSVLGGALEWALDFRDPSSVPLALRALWHGACAFGALYCSFLARLQEVAPRRASDGDAPR